MKIPCVLASLFFASTLTFHTAHAAEGDKPASYIGEKDCLVLNPSPKDDERIAWSGGCKNGFADGTGVLQFYLKDQLTSRYEGALGAGKREGKGIFTTPSGVKHVGTYVNNELTGEVDITSAKGDHYHGGWKNGRPEGSGKASSADGIVYEGEFKDGKRDGKGMTIFPNGNRYEGTYAGGYFDGQGTMQFATGARYEGSWKAGRYDGKGTLTSADGKSVAGDFSRGEKIAAPAPAAPQPAAPPPAAPALAKVASTVENGRLQICRIAVAPGSQSAPQKELDIPVDGKYVVTAAKLGLTEPIIITQTDFSPGADAASQAQANSTLRDQFKLENRDGKLLVHFDAFGAPCIYLNAAAPSLVGGNVTLSGSRVAPDWLPKVEGNNVSGVSYRYFNGVDQTYYVASEVGKNLSFAVHDMQTGSNLNHDRVQKVPVTNPSVLMLVSNAFKANLEQRNQYDTNLVDLGKYNINVQDIDLHSSADLRALVAQFTKAMRPPPHSRLILALPVRGQVQLKFSNTTLIGNKMEGMGFYRDSNLYMTADMGRDDFVPIGAFINFQAAVIDIDTATLVASQHYADGRMFFRPPVPEIDLVDTVSDVNKFIALNGVVRDGVGKVMNEMFVVK